MLDGKVDLAVDDSSGIGEFADGYTSGTARKMVDKGALDMADVVEVWRSPLIPNGPLVIRTAMGDEWIKKLTDFYAALPTTDAACFSVLEGGDFKGFSPVKAEFYNTIIEARKAAIGG
jgi:phosphonate transport system substrate-binding protein